MRFVVIVLVFGLLFSANIFIRGSDVVEAFAAAMVTTLFGAALFRASPSTPADPDSPRKRRGDQ